MMRRNLPFQLPLAAMLLSIAAPTALLAAEPLTAAERQRLLDHLDESRSLFLDAVAGLSPAQLAYKPAEDRWSVADNVEHLAAAEKLIRGTVVEMLETPAPDERLAEANGKEDRVIELMMDRSQKFQAPEPVQPSGVWDSVAAALDDFRDERAASAELAAAGRDLRAYCREHPAFGELDAYGWLFFLSSHTRRHTLQIEEVKADPGFPKG